MKKHITDERAELRCKIVDDTYYLSEDDQCARSTRIFR